MASLIKKAFNAARIRLGKTPLIVTTSQCMAHVTTHSGLSALLRMKSEWEEDMPAVIVAEAAEGLKAPEKQMWNIRADVRHYGSKEIEQGMTYQAMLAYLKRRELYAAREAGFTGTDTEIIAQRKTVVSRKNVLNFSG